MLNHDLPAGIPEWLAHVCGGELTRLERHTARREAWLVDVTGSTGGSVEGFLRLERAPNAENPWSLRHETRVVEALRDTNVPVPRVLAHDDALACTLFERVRGRSDLHNAPSASTASRPRVISTSSRTFTTSILIDSHRTNFRGPRARATAPYAKWISLPGAGRDSSPTTMILLSPTVLFGWNDSCRGACRGFRWFKAIRARLIFSSRVTVSLRLLTGSGATSVTL